MTTFRNSIKEPVHDELQESLTHFDYFKKWSMEQTEECRRISKLRPFGSGQIILGADYGEPTYVYFIVEGRCQIIEHLQVKKRKRMANMLPSTRGKLDKMQKNMEEGAVEDKFVQIAILRRLSCFNLGENLERRHILACVPTKCLMIPYYWLANQNTANIWTRTQQFLRWNIPDTRFIHESLIKEKKWIRYRRRTFRMSRKRQVDGAAFHQVPYSIRMDQANQT